MKILTYIVPVLIVLIGGYYFLYNPKSDVSSQLFTIPTEEPSKPAESVKKCGYIKSPTSGSSMVEYGIPADATEITINTCRWCQEGDVCAFICKSEKCFGKKLVENGEASDGRVGYNKILKQRKGDCYWFEGGTFVDADGTKYVSTDSKQYGWLCGNELEIAGAVVIPSKQ